LPFQGADPFPISGGEEPPIRAVIQVSLAADAVLIPRPILTRQCGDGWPTFTVFVKVGIHRGIMGSSINREWSLESSTQNQNNKLSASVVPTFTKNVKVGHPSVHALVKGWQGYKGAVDKCYDGG
jgi:hypothetical protein